MGLVCESSDSNCHVSLLSQIKVLGNLLALAGVCPFVGSLSDLLGRRYVALIGAALLVIGTVVATCAKSMNMFIGPCP